MFGSQVLEVAIGIVFIFILISIICTAIREGLESWLKTRAAYLEYGIRELLHDRNADNLAAAFYNHPLIYSLFADGYPATKAASGSAKRPSIIAKGGNLPSYIPANNFALALMDIAARGPHKGAATSDTPTDIISLDAIRSNIANLNNEAVQRVLLTAIDMAQGDINKVQASLQAWYDSGMDRVSGWYKRSTQWIIFGTGLFVAVGLNINTIAIADYLYRNDAVRAAIVAQAQTAATDTKFLETQYKAAKNDLDTMGLPIGWNSEWRALSTNGAGKAASLKERLIANPGWLPTAIAGWLVTAFAATLGAPFWFDMLNKVMVIRSTVKPHEKSPEESSEDRQVPPAAAAPRERREPAPANGAQPGR